MADQFQTNVTRRKLIQIVSAAGGALVLANLPIHWKKPAVKMGLLPAHAQSSGKYVVTAAADMTWVRFCYPLDCNASILPADPGIALAYTITTTGIASYTTPVSSTGVLSTDGSGAVSLHVTPNLNTIQQGDTITVTWSFVNSADGSNTDSQTCTNADASCGQP
jgi:hypothetical protein